MAAERSRPPPLAAAIDALQASYDEAAELNNFERSVLPRQGKVIEAFEHLKTAIFLGYHSHRVLTRDTLRSVLEEHLSQAYELLVEPIECAFRYGCEARHHDHVAEAIVLRLLGRLPELRRLLNADVVAAFRGDPAAGSVEEVVLSYPSITAICAHRVAHALHLEGVPFVPRMIAEHAHALTGIDIHPGAVIGESFFIDHGTGVVIGETTVIGDRVKLYQNVTLGALSTARAEAGRESKRHPTIEDDVTIYAGATILGGATVIGRGSVVGGNVWLVKSLPANRKIFGRAKA